MAIEGRPVLEPTVGEVGKLGRLLPSPGGEGGIAKEQIRILARYSQATAGCMNYCGTFEVVGDEVVHHVENNLFPEWIGTDLARTYRFDRDDQELRLKGDAGGLVQELVRKEVS